MAIFNEYSHPVETGFQIWYDREVIFEVCTETNTFFIK